MKGRKGHKGPKSKGLQPLVWLVVVVMVLVCGGVVWAQNRQKETNYWGNQVLYTDDTLTTEVLRWDTDGLKLKDQEAVYYGSDSDIRSYYDETTDDRLEWDDGTNLLMALSDAGTTGNLLVTGNATAGAGTGAPTLILNGAAANWRGLEFWTGGTRRWGLFADNNTESGSNAGSNLVLLSYNDAGTLIDEVLRIERGTSSAARWGRILHSTRGSATIQTVVQSGDTLTEGLRLRALEQEVTIGGAAASFDLTSDLPSGAIPVGGALNLQTAVTATTAVKVGLGTSGDPDKYGLTGALTKNSKGKAMVSPSVLGSLEDVKIFACDTGGAAAGTLDSGTVRVRLWFWDLLDLDSAP